MIIALSTSILINADRLRHVLLHEMCHVAVFQIDQIREAHGPNWQKWWVKRRFDKLLSSICSNCLFSFY